MLAPGPILAFLLTVFLAIPPAAAQAPDPDHPGPLVGGDRGAHYHGPGFTFYIPPGWVVELDEIAPGDSRPGERGTARGGGHRDTPEEAAAANASIRFEPFPLEPGATATIEDFESHIRRTLAADVPIASLPLTRPMFQHGGRLSPEAPDGITLLFTRAAPDRDPARQRRYFIHAHARPDGRLQTLICSHLGPADPRRFSILFTHIGQTFATTWPVSGPASVRTYHDAERGFALHITPKWRLTHRMQCGTGFLMMSEQERRRSFRKALHLVRTEADAHRAPPEATVVGFEIADEFPGTIEEWFDRQSLSSAPFAFEDGASGRIHQSESGLRILRKRGERALMVYTLPLNPVDREDALRLVRSVQFFEPAQPEQATRQEKQLRAQGVSIRYPGDWRRSRHASNADARTLSAAFEPIGPAEETLGGVYIPPLYAGVHRLDDLLADRERARSGTWPDEPRVRYTTTHEDHPFFTESGWDGWLWRSITTADGPRGRSIIRSTQYILPMPDGVMALQLSGTTMTTTRKSRREAAALERVWRRIAESAEVELDPH